MRCPFIMPDGTKCNEVVFSADGGHNRKHKLTRTEYRLLLGVGARKCIKRPQYEYIDAPTQRRKA